jgi:ABC-type bacteriocin/lantibiotic exporter with double-glycine peptidase domain
MKAIRQQFACVAFLGPFLLVSVVVHAVEEGDKLWRVSEKCGINSLYLMLRLRGQDVQYRDVENSLGWNPQGHSLSELQNTAANLAGQLELETVKGNYDFLQTVDLPVIAHFEEALQAVGHFVVIYAVNDRVVEYVDGTTAAPTKLERELFNDIWSGYLIVAKPSRQNYPRIIGIIAIVAFPAFLIVKILRRPSMPREPKCT